MPICSNKVRNGPGSARQVPCARHVMTMPTHLPLSLVPSHGGGGGERVPGLHIRVIIAKAMW